MVQGFKCFKKGLINRYGMIFELGKVYHDDKEIKFHQSGFHMCTNLEDTLRYFDAFNEEVDIASVIGSGKINKYDDEYNGFYDMYSVEYLQVCHVLTRDEIMNYVLDLPPMRVKRFISLYKSRFLILIGKMSSFLFSFFFFKLSMSTFCFLYNSLNFLFP